MDTADKVTIGVGATLLVALGVLVAYEWRKKLPTAAAIAAPGPYAPVPSAAGLQPGGTYLMSWSASAQPAASLADLVTQLRGINVGVSQSWDAGQVPAGWPAGDPWPNEWRVVAAIAPSADLSQLPPGGTFFSTTA